MTIEYSPSRYASEVQNGSITPKTAVNWCKKGFLNYRLTPTGRYIILVEDKSELMSNVDRQFAEIMAEEFGGY